MADYYLVYGSLIYGLLLKELFGKTMINVRNAALPA